MNHRAQALRDALTHIPLPRGRRLGRAVAEALGEPEKREQWQKKLRGSRKIKIEDIETIARLSGRPITVLPSGQWRAALAVGDRGYALELLAEIPDRIAIEKSGELGDPMGGDP